MKSTLAMGAAVLICLLTAASARGQTPPMTNADVIKMVSAGLSEQLVVGSIRNAKARSFDTSADALIELKKNNVPDGVIAEMMRPATAASPAAMPVPPMMGGMRPRMVASGDPNDPNQPHDAGIYLDMGESSKPRLVRLSEPKVVGQSMGGLLKSAATMGLSGSTMNYRVRGGRAETRTAQTSPVFYFYGMDPEDSPIIELRKKGDEREYTWMRMGSIVTGVQTRGAKAAVPVKVDKIATDIYRVIPTASVKPGEYGFPGGFMTGGVTSVWEFGVDK